MERMKHELRQYLSREGRGSAIRIIRAEGLNRNWIKDALGKPWNWMPERAELLDTYVKFSDRAWEEAYRIWDQRKTPSVIPFNRKKQVQHFIDNRPAYNWKVA